MTVHSRTIGTMLHRQLWPPRSYQNFSSSINMGTPLWCRGRIFCILFVFSPNEYLTPELKLPDRYMDADQGSESGFPPDPRSDEAAHGETTSASVAIDYKALPCSCQLINNVATPCSSDCKGLQRPSLATGEHKRPPIGSWDHHHIHEYCQQHPIN